MIKVSGEGLSCVNPLVNFLHIFAITGINRLCNFKTSYIKGVNERVDEQHFNIAAVAHSE